MNECCVLLVKHCASEVCEKDINAWSQTHVSMAIDAQEDTSHIPQHDLHQYPVMHMCWD